MHIRGIRPLGGNGLRVSLPYCEQSMYGVGCAGWLTFAVSKASLISCRLPRALDPTRTKSSQMQLIIYTDCAGFASSDQNST